MDACGDVGVAWDLSGRTAESAGETASQVDEDGGRQVSVLVNNCVLILEERPVTPVDVCSCVIVQR